MVGTPPTTPIQNKWQRPGSATKKGRPQTRSPQSHTQYSCDRSSRNPQGRATTAPTVCFNKRGRQGSPPLQKAIARNQTDGQVSMSSNFVQFCKPTVNLLCEPTTQLDSSLTHPLLYKSRLPPELLPSNGSTRLQFIGIYAFCPTRTQVPTRPISLQSMKLISHCCFLGLSNLEPKEGNAMPPLKKI